MHFDSSVVISQDGSRVLTTSSNVSHMWEMNVGPIPVPTWLPELAVTALGETLDSSSIPAANPAATFLKLKQQLRLTPTTNFYNRWAQWFIADRETRTISPFSKLTVPEYVQGRIQENSLESLREAVLLSPNNGVAFARLAQAVVAKKPKESPNWLKEADFYSRYATKLSPTNAEVLRIRGELEQRVINAKIP